MPKHSVEADNDAVLDQMFRALADTTRRAIIARLVHGPASVSQLAEPFDMALPTVVQHLRVLEQAQVVSSEKVGRVRTYQLVPDALVPANAWIVAHRRPHERQLDRLGDYLTKSPPSPEDPEGLT
jgi:DNA-binding transcriptional ArsR family regulator